MSAAFRARAGACCLATVLVLTGLSASALAQSAEQNRIQSYEGEIIVAANGTPTAPWKEIQNCDETRKCVVILRNSTTHEIARVGERLSTRFVPTGNGKEVRRAEPALDKARRLAGMTPPNTR